MHIYMIVCQVSNIYFLFLFASFKKVLVEKMGLPGDSASFLKSSGFLGTSNSSFSVLSFFVARIARTKDQG